MDLERWKGRFEEHLQLRNFSSRTIEGYVAELTPFFEFLEEQGVQSLGELTRSLVEGYRVHLFYSPSRSSDPRRAGQPLTQQSQARRLSAIKAFARFLYRQGYLVSDPAAGVELPRTRSPVPQLLSEEEARKLLQAVVPRTWLELRDRAILEVLYGTGIRNGELSALRLEAVQRGRRELAIQRGKNSKSRVVPLGEEAQRWLERYLTEARPQLVRPGKPDPGWLFLSWRGNRMDRPAVVNVVHRAAQRAGLEKRVFPHLLRHCCATHMLARGAGVRHLQLLLGHATLQATQRYTQLEVSDLRQVLLRCHPREQSP